MGVRLSAWPAKAVLVSALIAASPLAAEMDWSGYVSLEPRMFLDHPLFPQQPAAGVSPSAVLAPEIRYQWNDGDDRITIAPYLRWAADDSQRSHGDLREAAWLHVRGDWAWQVGLGHVFWGVTESRHLVDIINQTDQVEDLDEEDKLGQAMVSVERWTPAGTFGIFLLPSFRERPFPAAGARLRSVLPIDTEHTEYESSARDRRLDLALRWTNTIGNWDLGLSGFHGTSREPRLLPRLDVAFHPVLVPHYDTISQVGIDLQYTEGAWLWKLEAIDRHGQGKSFGALVAGLEYTLFDLGQHGIDLGLLTEYLYDGRDATAVATLYDDDWFVGFRLALNDTQDTMVLSGAIVDANGTFVVVEAGRRLMEGWKFEAEARLFLGIDHMDPFLGGLRNDSFITLRLAKYL